MSKSFIVYDLDGNEKEVSIGNDDYVSNGRCQRCGCNLIQETSEWSGISTCPICFYHYDEYYSDQKQLKSIRENMNRLIKDLNFYNDLYRVISGENNVREKNIKNELIIKEDEE